MKAPDPFEDIQTLKQRIADLENKAQNMKRSEHLLQAFNQASLAMSNATTPEEIFETVPKTLKRLGKSSVILFNQCKPRTSDRQFNYT